MAQINDKSKITIDEVDYNVSELSDEAKTYIARIQFTSAQILQLENELAISSTARNGYLRSLNTEIGNAGGKMPPT